MIQMFRKFEVIMEPNNLIAKDAPIAGMVCICYRLIHLRGLMSGDGGKFHILVRRSRPKNNLWWVGFAITRLNLEILRDPIPALRKAGNEVIFVLCSQK